MDKYMACDVCAGDLPHEPVLTISGVAWGLRTAKLYMKVLYVVTPPPPPQD